MDKSKEMYKNTNITVEQNEQYVNSVHRIGRIGSAVAALLMVGIPVVVGLYYNALPPISQVLQAGGGLLAIFLPIALSEVFSYAPILGSASYITFITGEVLNIKLPAAINAMDVAGVEQSTDEGDAIVTLSVSVASLFAMAVMLIGIFVFAPLRPVLEKPVVVTATSYMLPALFGALILGIFADGESARYAIKGKVLIAVPAFAIMILLTIFAPALVGTLSGVLILLLLPITIGAAWFMYQKGIVKVFESGSKEAVVPHKRQKKTK